jgi:hypothetical protein
MIESYLDAAGLDPRSGRREIGPLFEEYWAERQDRTRTRAASSFLVRMRRATRQTSRLEPEYRVDVNRVLADINDLPSTERIWTLLFVRTGVSFDILSEFLSERLIIDGLRANGSEPSCDSWKARHLLTSRTWSGGRPPMP